VGHKQSKGDSKGVYRMLVGENLRGKHHLEDPGVEGG
jgi:hypothetical protein